MREPPIWPTAYKLLRLIWGKKTNNYVEKSICTYFLNGYGNLGVGVSGSSSELRHSKEEDGSRELEDDKMRSLVALLEPMKMCVGWTSIRMYK